MSDRPQLTPALGLVRDRLSGPPPRPKTTAPVQLTPVEGENPSADRGAEATSKKARPKARSTSTGGMRRTTISIPQRLAAGMRERLQADRKLSQIQFILNAIEINAHRLEELVEKERPPTPPRSGLFPDQITGRSALEERTTINFDTTAANLKVIDSLVDKHGADSRSQLVRAAIRAVLAD